VNYNLQAAKQMTSRSPGPLGLPRDNKDKQFCQAGEHTHKLEESRKMDFFGGFTGHHVHTYKCVILFSTAPARGIFRAPSLAG